VVGSKRSLIRLCAEAGSLQACVPAQTILDQERGQAAAAATFLQGLLLQACHHATRQGHIEALRFSGFSHLRRSGRGLFSLEPLLEFVQERAKN